ncbi:hypothetical protein N0V88_000663 [Collariella sp. IMI 366227]|nr:hypothetical protein N0V88_000663 [Collariella sp. IMI 366227]
MRRAYISGQQAKDDEEVKRAIQIGLMHEAAELQTVKAENRQLRHAAFKCLQRAQWDKWNPSGDPIEQLLEFATSMVDKAQEMSETTAPAAESQAGTAETGDTHTTIDSTRNDLELLRDNAQLAELRSQVRGRGNLGATYKGFFVNASKLINRTVEGWEREVDQHAVTKVQLEKILESVKEAEAAAAKSAVDLEEKLAEQKQVHQRALNYQEERHSAIVDRMIDDHMAEMEEQMTRYETEFVQLQLSHERKLALREESSRHEVRRLEDRVLALEDTLMDKSPGNFRPGYDQLTKMRFRQLHLEKKFNNLKLSVQTLVQNLDIRLGVNNPTTPTKKLEGPYCRNLDAVSASLRTLLARATTTTCSSSSSTEKLSRDVTARVAQLVVDAARFALELAAEREEFVVEELGRGRWLLFVVVVSWRKEG